MLNLTDMRVGSVIRVRPDWGTAPAVEATVLDLCSDIKNGRPGIDYRRKGGEFDNWAYLDAVDCVLKY